MVIHRQCSFRLASGEPCRAAPLKDSQFCIMHSPEHAQEIQEARKLGGVRRKREVTLAGAYEFDGIDSVQGIKRILEIAMLDTLAMENSLSRNRTLAYLALAAMKALEVGVQEDRITALEQAVNGRQVGHKIPVFDVDKRLLSSGYKETNDNREAPQ